MYNTTYMYIVRIQGAPGADGEPGADGDPGPQVSECLMLLVYCLSCRMIKLAYVATM